MLRIGRLLVSIILTLLVTMATAWVVMALCYQLPLPQPLKISVGCLFGLLGLATIVALFTRLRTRSFIVVLGVDYSDDALIFDVVQQGPILGLVTHF